MDTARSQGVLINAAGFLYASLGFSLSVIAALFNLFHRAKTPNALLLSLPLSAHPRPVEKLPEQSSEKRTVSIHRRSRSIPLIAIDYLDSNKPAHHTSPGFQKMEPGFVRPVTPLSAPRPHSTATSPSPSETSSAPSTGSKKSRSRLFNLKSWGKDRPKVERRQSSPQLCRGPCLPLISSCQKETNSDSGLLKKSKSQKMLRKAASVHGPISDKTATKVDPRDAEKYLKRSQTLRTQPYEAPYFCMPPVPVLVQKSSRHDSTTSNSSSSESPSKTSLEGKLSRPRLPTRS